MNFVFDIYLKSSNELVETLTKIAKVFGVGTGSLLEGESPQKKQF